MNFLYALLLGSALVGAVLSVRIGDACSNHTYCNYGPESVANSRCYYGKCRCIELLHGEPGEDKCMKASLGDDCSNKTDPHRYCTSHSLATLCINGTTCGCYLGFSVVTSPIGGKKFCRLIEIGSECDPADGGDALCQTSIGNSICAETKSCQCPMGMVYARFTGLCQKRVQGPVCKKCEETGGACVLLSPSNQTMCTCRTLEYTMASGLGSLSDGCEKLVGIGEFCDSEVKCYGYKVKCAHDGGLSNRFSCVCEAGYVAIPAYMYLGLPVKRCVKAISPMTDRNCESCIKNNGICYDSDEDGARDGCVCPDSRSTSDPYDPSTDCDTSHVTVECSASQMSICYIPHNTTAFPNMSARLDALESLVYIKNYYAKDPCIPQKTVLSGDWCVTLSLEVSKMAACGTTASYPTRNTITYQNFLVVKNKKMEKNCRDMIFHAYCQYDTRVHAFTASGTEVTRFAIAASEGEKIHPELDMVVYDEFRRDASVQGIRLGQPAMLEVTMIDDKGVYNSLRPEVCIATNRPELANPATSSIMMLYGGCPVEDSYLHMRNTFYPDAVSPMISRTGLFPIFKFEDSDFVFFHCAVRVCRFTDNCKPTNCTSGRRKRSVGDESGATPEDGGSLTIVKRAIPGAVSLEPLVSRPIKIAPKDDQENAGKAGDMDKNAAFYRNPILMMGAIGGVLVVLAIVIVATAISLNRRGHARKATISNPYVRT